MSPIGDISAIEAEIDRIRSLGLAALRARWRSLFDAPPADGLTKDLIARMIAYRAQEKAFGGLDRQTLKLMDRLARVGKSGSESTRRFKAGTVLVREHCGERHTVTVVCGRLRLERRNLPEPVERRPRDYRHSLERATVLRTHGE